MTSQRTCQHCGTTLRPGDRFCANCGTDHGGEADALHGESHSLWDVVFRKLQVAAAPRYRVLRPLGYGGMGAVYLADEPRLGRRVAIKVMAPTMMVDPGLVRRFEQEARTTAQLHHPNIVTIFDVEARDELHYFVMAYIAGRTLGDVMAGRKAPLPAEAVAAWLTQVGNALAFAHRHGVIHRDVKPGNILLNAEGNALVTDFGIAKVADEPGLTRTGMLVGTPAYMSPEQCTGAALTGASDQYALGIVAYEMLTGRPPFTGATLAVLQAHIAEPPPPISELRPDCPPELRTVVERMLAKKPEERFSDLSAMVAALNAPPLVRTEPLRARLAALEGAAESISLLTVPAIVAGDVVTLRAEVRDRAGALLDDVAVHWASNDPSVASVTEAGELQAHAPGRGRIRGTCGECEAAFVIEVVPPRVARVKIHGARDSVAVGESLALEARVTDADGETMDVAVVWASSEPELASVSPDGRLEALRPGTVAILATAGGRSDHVTLDVRAAERAAPVPGSASAASAAAGAASSATPGMESGARAEHAQAPGPRPGVSTPVSGDEAEHSPTAPRPRTRRRLRLGAAAGVAVLVVTVAALTLTRGDAERDRLATLGSGGQGDVVEADSTVSAVGAADADGAGGSRVPDRAGDAGGTGITDRTGAADRADDADATGGAAGSAARGEDSEGSRVASGEDDVLAGGNGSAVTVTTTASPSGDAAPPSGMAALPRPPATGLIRIGGELPAGAVVTVVGTGIGARRVVGDTISLPPGRYDIEAAAGGYEPVVERIDIVAGETSRWTPVLVALTPSTTAEAPSSAEAEGTDSAPADDGTAAVAAATAAVRQEVERFVASIESRDIDAIVRGFPGAAGEWQQRWGPFLREVRRIDAELVGAPEPEVAGDAATVAFTVRLEFVDARNRPSTVQLAYVASFERRDGRWLLMRLEESN